MYRWDIINHLIKKNNYKSYLEIGYYKGWSFDRVECERKTAVDPNPCKEPWMEENEYSSMLFADEEPVNIYKLTSDDFFGLFRGFTYDIIFIDGLHESQQVNRDIQNALKHLSPGGTIVLHDCNPSTEEMTLGGTVNGEWTGDVYKSFCKYRATHLNETYVVDTDYGVGIIKDKVVPYNKGFCAVTLPPMDWEQFEKYRKGALNLISPEEFLKREQINQEENV